MRKTTLWQKIENMELEKENKRLRRALKRVLRWSGNFELWDLFPNKKQADKDFKYAKEILKGEK